MADPIKEFTALIPGAFLHCWGLVIYSLHNRSWLSALSFGWPNRGKQQGSGAPAPHSISFHGYHLPARQRIPNMEYEYSE